MKVEKTKEDKLAENNRNELLKFLNASYDWNAFMVISFYAEDLWIVFCIFCIRFHMQLYLGWIIPMYNYFWMQLKPLQQRCIQNSNSSGRLKILAPSRSQILIYSLLGNLKPHMHGIWLVYYLGLLLELCKHIIDVRCGCKPRHLMPILESGRPNSANQDMFTIWILNSSIPVKYYK